MRFRYNKYIANKEKQILTFLRYPDVFVSLPTCYGKCYSLLPPLSNSLAITRGIDILDSRNWHQQHNCENIIGFILTASNNGLFKEFVFICSSTVLCL